MMLLAVEQVVPDSAGKGLWLVSVMEDGERVLLEGPGDDGEVQALVVGVWAP
jgi:hypothetical protein